MATTRKPVTKSKTPHQDRYDPDRPQRQSRRVVDEVPPDDENMYLGDDVPEDYQPERPATRRQQPKPRVNKTTQHRVLPWNNVVFEGTVFGDPEVKVNDEGDIWMSSFSLAIYNGKTGDGAYRPSVWILVKVYGDLAEEVDKDVSDRCRIHVEGMLDQFKTEDGRYLFSVRCDYWEVTRR